MIPENAEWQMVGPDEWVFGVKVRGIVRVHLANVYYDEESNNPIGGWRWLLLGRAFDFALEKSSVRGVSASLSDAICDAEQAMGIRE